MRFQNFALIYFLIYIQKHKVHKNLRNLFCASISKKNYKFQSIPEIEESSLSESLQIFTKASLEKFLITLPFKINAKNAFLFSNDTPASNKKYHFLNNLQISKSASRNTFSFVNHCFCCRLFFRFLQKPENSVQRKKITSSLPLINLKFPQILRRTAFFEL